VVVGLLLQTQKIGRQRSNRKKKRRGKKRPLQKKKKNKRRRNLFSFFLSVRVQKYMRAGKDKTNDISDQRADFNSFSGFDFKTGTKKS